MAPSWVFAVIFFISAFLAMGQGSVTFCGHDGSSQCVDRSNCGPQRGVDYRMVTVPCPDNQVCCQVDEINNLAADELDYD